MVLLVSGTNQSICRVSLLWYSQRLVINWIRQQITNFNWSSLHIRKDFGVIRGIGYSSDVNEVAIDLSGIGQWSCN